MPANAPAFRPRFVVTRPEARGGNLGRAAAPAPGDAEAAPVACRPELSYPQDTPRLMQLTGAVASLR